MNPKIALIFDFDDTLAPDSTTGLMLEMGFDAPSFWEGDFVRMLASGWDQVPGFLHRLIELSEEKGGLLTRDYLADWGRRLPLFEGVAGFFDQLRQFAQEQAPGVDLEFYLISSGIDSVLRHTAIAQEFTEIFASDFHFNEAGRAVAAKRVVSFTDKTRYLFMISKGIIGEETKKYYRVNDRFDSFRIPFTQMIFVGDGGTDIPCFSLLKRKGGQRVAVYHGEHRASWKKARGFVKDERVEIMEQADYSPHSPLMNSLKNLLLEIVEQLDAPDA
ncbi:MAG: haloacid dehalogenase-like hydrolase [bacterium]|nr:haloacid dehalogenase-like hydrolase [bacterium]